MAISDAYVQVECDFCQTSEEVTCHWRSGGYYINEKSVLDDLGWEEHEFTGKIECEDCRYDRQADEERSAEAEEAEKEILKGMYWV